MYFFSPLAGSPARLRQATIALALTLALAGCATVPPPNNALNLAQNQLQAARDAGAAGACMTGTTWISVTSSS